MSDRLKQAVGKFATIRSVAVVALVAVGAIAAVVAAPAFSHRAIAAGCNNGLNVDTQYNTGACVGEITSGNFVTDYIIVVVDAAATNGVKVPTDIAAGIVLGGITGHQVFNFIPNTSAVNEYVGKPDIQADPTKANQYGNVGVSIPMAKNCSAANSTDALTVSATSPGTGETQKATINFCDIQRDTKQHGYFEKVTLQFSKAGTTSSSAQCSGGALGWIICPVVDFLIGTMQFLQNTFIMPYLSVSPLSIGDTNDTVFKLWDTVRNLANVVLVLLFFVVIFSQATSIGVSQYGIKRMLPRLLTAAVLANISYYLLAFIIDTFNLFGAGVSQLVTSTILSAGNGTGGSTSNAGSIFLVVGIGVGAILLTGGLASPIITWVMSLIGTAFLILLAAVAILVIRQMLIIVIVIASPLLLVLRAIEDA